MVNILLLINLLLCFYILIKKYLLVKKVKLDHVFLFIIGFIFYWLLPIAIGENNLFHHYPMMNTWYNYYQNISEENKVYYLLTCSAVIVTFLISDYLCNKSLIKNLKYYKSKTELYVSRKILSFFLYFTFLIYVLYLLKIKDKLFTGYTLEYSIDDRGFLIGLSYVILAICFIYTTKNDLDKNFINRSLGLKIFYNKYFFIYFISSLFILSLGTRLYFISSVFMLLSYITTYHSGLSKGKLFFSIIVLILFMSIVGILRFGSTEFSFENIMYVFLGESLYTGFSLLSFIALDFLSIINLPTSLFSQFINLIPTFLLPNKLEYIIDFNDMGYHIYAPLGALNSFVSLNINFGILGTICFIIVFVILLNIVKNLGQLNSFYRVIYVFINGAIPFSFFRDPFSISIVKLIFQYSLLLPVILVLIVHVISIVLLKNRVINISLKG
ncbi:O-antigen polymerase [Paranoxybacillus vitaminiphilus]|nr:O-antigen polymerase [Anoxybacillus vitaminiphilus]